MKQAFTLLGLGALAAWLGVPTGAAAQTTNYAAGNQWGTTPSGLAVPGALESAQAHSLNTAIAAAANGARQNVLVSSSTSGGGSLTISSIGSQTTVSSSIVATNSSIASPIDANQTSSNTGAVTNQGTINGR